LASDEISRKRLESLVAAGGFVSVASASAVDALALDADVVVIAATALTSETVTAVRRAHPHVAIVAFAPDGDARTTRRALDAGVDAVVPESRAPESLAPAVAAALAGLVALPRDARGHMLKPALSPREKQAVGLVVLGLSNGEIARKLHLAETTVKSHLSSAFRKLGVRSRSEAAALVLDPDSGLGLGILSISDGEDR